MDRLRILRGLGMRILGLVCALAIVSGAISTTQDSHAAAAGGIGGKVTLPLTISFVSFPASKVNGPFSQLTCTLSITGDDALTPSDSISIPLTVSGNSGTCNLSMSYLWHVVNPKSHITISYSVQTIGIDTQGHQTITRLSSGGVEKKVLPANGFVTAYKAFKVVL